MRIYAPLGILLAAPLATGCVMAPALPGGPLQGTSVQGEVDAGLSYASGVVTDQFADGTSKETRGPQRSGGPSPGRLGGRAGVTDWLDGSVDYSWADWGFEVRAGQPEWTRLPFAVSFAQRYGLEGFGAGHDDHFERRVRGEIYPRLWTTDTKRTHLIASLGVSVGDRAQTVEATPDDFWMIREETRLDAALGLEMRNRKVMIAIVALPYLVLDHGPTYDLDGLSALELDRVFGVAVFAKFGLSFTLHRFTGGILPEREASERQGLGE